ncbi:DUF397 domain-containing protein [Actinomadura sp. ATCC 31491]|uniref:DUF397 domain-containing protein n=1 Tax=Actinomadura luzonensis TaxID=2805427 RepID=A0ABT0GAZ6_9ACTN|nr:DUF397 domain-containing protein [Actinomadura luzonensis]MCK2221762.1 DUF397 domain-containing protein [Actinomadura luzonensis]
MSTGTGLDGTPSWRTASRCSNGDCVEVALLSPDTVGVRDTKNPGGPVITFSSHDWTTFVKRIQDAH